MSSQWFDEHVYTVVVPKRFVRRQVQAAHQKPTIVLEPWDVFGSLYA